MSKKNKIIGLVLVIVILGIILYLWRSLAGGNISGVNRTIGKSEVYSERDIEDAMNIAERKFKSDFTGCTLTDLWYDEDISKESTDEWAEQYNAGEAIVLESNFKAGLLGIDGSLEPGETYTEWQWILVRNDESSQWVLETWGY